MTGRRQPGAILPETAYGAALAALPRCSPGRLAALLGGRTAEEAWAAVAEGRLTDDGAVAAAWGGRGARLLEAWGSAARETDVARGWEDLRSAGVRVDILGRPGYPAALAGDHEAPAVLFSRGSLEALGHPRAAIVGTRRCTHYGREVARELGRELAAAGVAVVSGLALGVDGASHEGALAAGGAPPIAVVGSGLDVVYPSRHAGLWRRVAEAGVVLSEWPLGTPPHGWRFPARNRILAALASVVVVAESHEAGGSMSTVASAEARGVKVMAVPGSIRSPASAGTNRLLSEGVAPVQDAQDVLVALALEGALRTAPAGATDLGPEEETVLAAIEWAPTSTEEVLGRSGLAVGRVALVLNRLQSAGLVRRSGGWWEREPA